MTPRGGLFISYARADASVALRLYEVLAAAGQDVWLDIANLGPGIDWWDGARRAIDQSAAVLFLVSGESSRSRSCSRELVYTVACGKRIVPIAVGRGAFPASVDVATRLGIPGMKRELARRCAR